MRCRIRACYGTLETVTAGAASAPPSVDERGRHAVKEAERPGNPDDQRCPSCDFTHPRQSHLRDARQVWFVCGRCGLSWSIADRRGSPSPPYDGVERRVDDDDGG
jgi:hypothetical protein